MLVLRPADVGNNSSMETGNGKYSNSYCIDFSRQNIANLPQERLYSNSGKRCLYIVAGADENADVILVASGSEVSTLVAGAELLRKDR